MLRLFRIRGGIVIRGGILNWISPDMIASWKIRLRIADTKTSLRVDRLKVSVGHGSRRCKISNLLISKFLIFINN